MRIDELETAFYEKDVTITEEQAKERAFVLLDAMAFCEDADYEDEWFGLSDDWDLNIWRDSDGKINMHLYPVKNGKTRSWINRIKVL